MTTEKKAHEATDRISGSLHEAIDKAADTASRVADNLGERKDQIVQTQDRLVGECRGFVKENPLTALAIAAGVGYFISRVTR